MTSRGPKRPKPAGFRAKPGHDALFEQHFDHQIAWKESFNRDCPLKKDGSRHRRLFLREDRMLNIYPPFREAVETYVAGIDEAEPVKLHTYFGNVMSSQAFAMNLAAPFLENPSWLTPVLRTLADDALGAADGEVERVGVEVLDEHNYFNEPMERRSSPDIGVWWRTSKQARLLLIEVK